MNSFDTNADLHMNPKTNLLEQAEFNYILQDVEKPNLYRQNFKYDEVPKIVLTVDWFRWRCRRNLDYGYDLPGWPTVQRTVYDGTDCAFK